MSTYGNGPEPVFVYDLANGSSALDRWTIKIDNADYVYVENLAFDDPSMDSNVHDVDANVGIAVFITQSDNCIVRNITVENLGEGIVIGGNHCLIENNNLSHLRMIRNTPETSGLYGDDDFGAAAVVITGSHNQILNNHLEDNWGHSYDYRFDGGGIEIFGSNSDSNVIMRNTVIECNGFTEIGGAQTAWDNVYAYNLVINCTVIGAFHLSGNFGTDIQRMKIYNNVFIETKKHLTEPSRILGIGALTSSNASDILTLKNNIFYLATGVNMAHSSVIGNSYGSRIMHENNIYVMNGGSVNYPLHSSELLLNLPTDIFTDATNANPALWDYTPGCMSPAIDFGQNLSFFTDFNETEIANLPDAGIIENTSCNISSLNIKVLLESSYNGNDLMNNNLLGLLPSQEPYAELGYVLNNEEVTDTNVLLQSGVNKVIDWVVVEVRAEDRITVLNSKPALLLANGQVVDVDGVSPLMINTTASNGYIVVLHRNHLGVMNKEQLSFNNETLTVDFTDIDNIYTDNSVSNPPVKLMPNGSYALYKGDINNDGQVNSTDASSVFLEAVPITSNIYNVNDVDMNGQLSTSDAVEAFKNAVPIKKTHVK